MRRREAASSCVQVAGRSGGRDARVIVIPNLPLEDALQLVHLYFERGSPKAEPAARRWLVRYLSEGTPSLRDVAKVTASLAEASSRASS